VARYGSLWALCKVTERIGCEHMFRWLIVVFLALLLFQGAMPWLQKLGFGRLPGDFRFRLFGREFFLPLTTTLILSMVCAALSRLL